MEKNLGIFKNKTAVITGAGSGIGRCIALRFAEEGADVGLIDINEQGLKETAEKVKSLGRKSITCLCDMSEVSDIDAAVKMIYEEFEKVDIYNITNVERFSTYVIYGEKAEIGLNGAAARRVHKGDLIIIASYAEFTEEESQNYKAKLVFVDQDNCSK